MPRRMCGSVSARLSVWFSRVIAALNAARRAASGSTPPAVERAERLLAAASGGCAARFFVPASVSVSVPVEKSKAASPSLPGELGAGGFQ